MDFGALGIVLVGMTFAGILPYWLEAGARELAAKGRLVYWEND